jgi:hypothetical protein
MNGIQPAILARSTIAWLSVFATDTAFSAWDLAPNLELAVETRDNPRLDTGTDTLPLPPLIPDNSSEDDVATLMNFNGRFTMSNMGPRSFLVLEPRLRVSAANDPEDEDLESEDWFFDARGQRRWEKSSAGFTSNFSRESILYSEILEAEPIDPDVDDPIAIDTGRLARLDENRDRASIAPYAEFQVSERNTLLLEARVLDVTYSDTSVTGRTDFTDAQFAAGIARQLNDRNRMETRLVASRFSADATQNETDTVGIEATFSRAISDIWTLRLTPGLQRSEIAFRNPLGQLVEDEDDNFTFELGLRKRSELATLNLDLQHLVDPNSSGFVEQRDEFRVSVDRRVSESLTASFAIRLIDTSALGDLQTSSRDYARLALGLEWAVKRAWSIGVGYDGIYQKFENQEDATSNSVAVYASYRGLSRAPN